jgi:hypothetical protein
VLPLASIFSQILNGFGGTAAVMAVGIFIGQAKPSLAGEGDDAVRRGATVGGLSGLGFVLYVLVLSALLS